MPLAYADRKGTSILKESDYQLTYIIVSFTSIVVTNLQTLVSSWVMSLLELLLRLARP